MAPTVQKTTIIYTFGFVLFCLAFVAVLAVCRLSFVRSFERRTKQWRESSWTRACGNKRRMLVSYCLTKLKSSELVGMNDLPQLILQFQFDREHGRVRMCFSFACTIEKEISKTHFAACINTHSHCVSSIFKLFFFRCLNILSLQARSIVPIQFGVLRLLFSIAWNQLPKIIGHKKTGSTINVSSCHSTNPRFSKLLIEHIAIDWQFLLSLSRQSIANYGTQLLIPRRRKLAEEKSKQRKKLIEAINFVSERNFFCCNRASKTVGVFLQCTFHRHNVKRFICAKFTTSPFGFPHKNYHKISTKLSQHTTKQVT